MTTKTAPKQQKESNTAFKKTVRRLVRLVWIGVFLSIGAFFLLFFGAAQGWLGEMPDVTELENPDIYVASEIISQDGVILGKFETEKRIPLEYKDIPPNLVNALLAKEDNDFKNHSGIDGKALFRVIASQFGYGQKSGGSTITQQLAKLLFSEDFTKKNQIERGLQKVKEYIVAVQLERLYTKEEIIAMYLNKHDFLYGAYGVNTASKVYFNKDLPNITLDEAAVFVAMLQKPGGYNPKMNPEAAVEGRDGVLNKMAELGYITPEEAKKNKAKPIVVDFQPVKIVGEEFSAYYKKALQDEVQVILEDLHKSGGKKYNLYKDGLKIYVTLDSRMQKYAEEAMHEHLKTVQRQFWREQRGNPYFPYRSRSMSQRERLFERAMHRTERYKGLKAKGFSDDSIKKLFQEPTRLEIFTWDKGTVDTLMSPWDSIVYHKSIVQASLMSMEPTTGSIKAWVGGVNWNHFKYDLVKQGKRQVGSTFKPIVYVTAIKDVGLTPCDEISNATYNEGGWRVLGSGGMMSIRQGLAHSKNPIAARLIHMTGKDLTIKTARDMGITSDLPHNQTIALGSAEISLYEMVGAYSTFANQGNYIKPEMIWRIEDNKGKVIKEYQPEIKAAMDNISAYTMLDMMQGVTRFGTARKMRGMGITADVAGKTGTTNDNSDAWFIGITPKLTTGVWVGWQERFARLRWAGEGASSALPIWVRFMKKVYADEDLEITQKDEFTIPEEIKNGKWGECGLVQENEDIYFTAGDLISGENLSNDTIIVIPDAGVNTKLTADDTLNWDKLDEGF